MEKMQHCMAGRRQSSYPAHEHLFGSLLWKLQTCTTAPGTVCLATSSPPSPPALSQVSSACQVGAVMRPFIGQRAMTS
jgi:hypothetical protein